MMSLETQITELLERTATELVQLVRQDMYQQIASALGEGTGTREPRSAPRRRTTVAIKSCKVQGCDKPHKGPRFRFLCDDHRVMPQAKIEELLRGTSKAAPSRSAAASKKQRTATKPAKKSKKLAKLAKPKASSPPPAQAAA